MNVYYSQGLTVSVDGRDESQQFLSSGIMMDEPALIEAGCWAPARRRFFDALASDRERALSLAASTTPIRRNLRRDDHTRINAVHRTRTCGDAAGVPGASCSLAIRGGSDTRAPTRHHPLEADDHRPRADHV